MQRRASRRDVSCAFERVRRQWRALSVYGHGSNERQCKFATPDPRAVQTLWRITLDTSSDSRNGMLADHGVSPSVRRHGSRKADGLERRFGCGTFLCRFECGRVWWRQHRRHCAATHHHSSGNFDDCHYASGDVFHGATVAIAAHSTHADSEITPGSKPAAEAHAQKTFRLLKLISRLIWRTKCDKSRLLRHLRRGANRPARRPRPPAAH